ncbi:MAG: right-handed parallel beta-helix repeat-containing protein [Limisphaerales bacterium]
MTTKAIAGVLSLWMAMSSSISAASGQTFYIATSGNDANPGTKAKPFATLERARAAVRDLKSAPGLPSGGVTVFLRGGVYLRADSFELTAADSGLPEAPIHYRGAAREEVRLIGGRPVSNWKAVIDEQVLRRRDPAAIGITNYGKLLRRGFGGGNVAAHLELFFQGRPMTLARWPNEGWAKIAGVPAGPEGGKFAYADDRPRRWTNAPDLWVHGYWTWDWADSYEKVKAVDLEKREIATEPPHGVYGYKTGQGWYALNLLEELDSPGEYYLDRQTGILYFWPPAPLSAGPAFVSLLEKPVIDLQHVHDVVLAELTIEDSRGVGIEINQCTNVLVAACTLRNLGTTAINLSGAHSGIRGCDIYDVGDGAISLSGGDRQTLTPGGNFVDNCDLHHFSRWSRTYHPAIGLQGVGNRITHNLIHDAPHTAILGGGNEHLIEFNEIHHVCLETSDAGAFYMGRDLTQRGNVVRFNYFHHLDARPDVQSVYLDDCFCGTTVFGNIIFKGGRGVEVGGGRDNLVLNNVFVDCRPAIHVDARAKGWAKFWFDGRDPTLLNGLKAVNFNQPPYSVRYPELGKILEDDPAQPKGNHIERNIAVGGRWLDLLDHLTTNVVVVRDNFVGGDPGFVSMAKQDFRLKKNSPVWRLGFQRIPIEKIGLYRDEFRKRLP